MSQIVQRDFFISYTSADSRWAEWIAWQLEEAGYSVILQAWDFRPGTNFVSEMNRAITTATRTLAVLSPQYLSALYTQPEWGAAFRRDPKGEQGILVPVRVQECEVTGLLGQVVYVDLVGQKEADASQMLLAGVRHERAKPQVAPIFPDQVEHTVSKQLNFPGDLPPIWNVPYERNPLFVGREQDLKDLSTTLATKNRAALLQGVTGSDPGASGATETAVEYAYRYQADYHVVLWVQAHSREALTSGFATIASLLNLSEKHAPDRDRVVNAVRLWLQSYKYCLLVLEDVQDPELVNEFIPAAHTSYLLLTTRVREVGRLAPLVELDSIKPEERTFMLQLAQVVGAALQGPQGRMPLGLEAVSIGRVAGNRVVLNDPAVSSRHAALLFKKQGYWLLDLGSTNGTFVNSKRLDPQVPYLLQPGNVISIGSTTFTYEVSDLASRRFSSALSPVSTAAEQPSRSMLLRGLNAGSRASQPPDNYRSTRLLRDFTAGPFSPSAGPESGKALGQQPWQLTPSGGLNVGSRVGQRLGNYRLTRLLGQGGFAEVYLGVHLHLETPAAIKVLLTQLAGEDLEQFRTEARTIARLLHPHIVRVLEFGVDGTTPYLVMDYASNGTLRQRHPKGTRLPVDTVVYYVNQIAPALHFAHTQRLIHRDIKPENLLLGRADEILLSDFGIALVAQSSRYQGAQDMAGTIAYMAPEQIQAHPRPASDQYSLGIVVYEWLSGDRPFHGSFTEIAIKHSVVAPPSLSEKVPTLSPVVEQVVMTALAKNPQQRFEHVQAFAQALEQASQTSQRATSPLVPPHPNPSPTSPLAPSQVREELPFSPMQPAAVVPERPVTQLPFTPPPYIGVQTSEDHSPSAFSPKISDIPSSPEMAPGIEPADKKLRKDGEQKQNGKVQVWKIGKRQLVAMGVGIAIYGVLCLIFDNGMIRLLYWGNPSKFIYIIFDNYYYSDGISVGITLILLGITLACPLLFSVKFGPWVGLVSAFLGGAFGGLLSGLSVYPGFWDLNVAIAFVAFVSGLTLYVTQGQYKKRKAIFLSIGIIAPGIVIGSVFFSVLLRYFDTYWRLLDLSLLAFPRFILVSATGNILSLILLLTYNAIVSRRKLAR